MEAHASKGQQDHSDRRLRGHRPRAGAGARRARRTRWRSRRATGSGSSRWRRSAAPRRRSAAPLPTDVTNQQDCEWLVAETVKAFGGIDVVIHNAGITMWSRFDALQDLSIFERIMEVNYLAPVRLTALALPHLKQSKRIDRRGREPRRAHRRAGTLGLCGQQARDDRLLRFAAHRAARAAAST